LVISLDDRLKQGNEWRHWSLHTHFTAHDAEATAAFSPEQLSQGTGDPQGAQ